MNKRISYAEVALIFLGTLLFISVYFIIFSYLIGSDYRLYANSGDVVNMLSFAFVSSALIVSFFGLQKAGETSRFCSRSACWFLSWCL